MSKIVRNQNQRVAILVDVQNLYYSAKNLYSSRINFRKLLELALSDRILIRAIAYVIKSDEREQDFFDAVNNAGFEIKEKEIQIFADGSKKGDWDVGIAMDAIRMGDKVDSIVLVSGDGDYLPVVSYLQQRFGCLVEVIGFEATTSKVLRETAHDYVAVESDMSGLLFKTARSSKKAAVSEKIKPAKKEQKRGSSTKKPKPSANSSKKKKPSIRTFLGIK